MAEIPHVTLQQLHDIRLNPWAVELLVEAWRQPAGRKPLSFIFHGVKISLETVLEPDDVKPQDDSVSIGVVLREPTQRDG